MTPILSFYVKFQHTEPFYFPGLFWINIVSLIIKFLINWHSPDWGNCCCSWSTVAESRGHTFQDPRGSARSDPGCDHSPLFGKEALSYCTACLKKILNFIFDDRDQKRRRNSGPLNVKHLQTVTLRREKQR